MNEVVLYSGFFILLIIACVLVIYPFFKSKNTWVLLSLFVVGFAGLAYWHWGALPQLKHHLQQAVSLQQVQETMKSIKGPEELINKLKLLLFKFYIRTIS